jgi:hypothetical protein
MFSSFLAYFASVFSEKILRLGPHQIVAAKPAPNSECDLAVDCKLGKVLSVRLILLSSAAAC